MSTLIIETVDVIFRKFNDGDIIALFPGEPATDWTDCSSYQHIGQHGPASLDLSSITKPATAEDYAPLLAELERIGYSESAGFPLRIVRKFTRAHTEMRRDKMRRINAITSAFQN